MSMMRDLENFVRTHRFCGGMTGDVCSPTAGGYLVWVTCECEEEFERWVTPEMADEDLIRTDLLVCPN